MVIFGSLSYCRHIHSLSTATAAATAMTVVVDEQTVVALVVGWDPDTIEVLFLSVTLVPPLPIIL